MRFSDFKVDVGGDEEGSLNKVAFDPMPVFIWHHVVAARQELEDALDKCAKLDMRDEKGIREVKAHVYRCLDLWIRKKWLVSPSWCDGSAYMKLYNVE